MRTILHRLTHPNSLVYQTDCRFKPGAILSANLNSLNSKAKNCQYYINQISIGEHPISANEYFTIKLMLIDELGASGAVEGYDKLASRIKEIENKKISVSEAVVLFGFDCKVKMPAVYERSLGPKSNVSFTQREAILGLITLYHTVRKDWGNEIEIPRFFEFKEMARQRCIREPLAINNLTRVKESYVHYAQLKALQKEEQERERQRVARQLSHLHALTQENLNPSDIVFTVTPPAFKLQELQDIPQHLTFAAAGAFVFQCENPSHPSNFNANAFAPSRKILRVRPDTPPVDNPVVPAPLPVPTPPVILSQTEAQTVQQELAQYAQPQTPREISPEPLTPPEDMMASYLPDFSPQHYWQAIFQDQAYALQPQVHQAGFAMQGYLYPTPWEESHPVEPDALELPMESETLLPRDAKEPPLNLIIHSAFSLPTDIPQMPIDEIEQVLSPVPALSSEELEKLLSS